jgi:hypothetical protein
VLYLKIDQMHSVSLRQAHVFCAALFELVQFQLEIVPEVSLLQCTPPNPPSLPHTDTHMPRNPMSPCGSELVASRK